MLGSSALAALLMTSLTTWEGKENRAYRDIVGVVTACRGTTKGVELGRVYTDAECDAMEEAGVIEHLAGVRRATPAIAGRELVAATLLTYNIGVAGYAGSTAARRFFTAAARSSGRTRRSFLFASGAGRSARKRSAISTRARRSRAATCRTAGARHSRP